MLDWYSSYLYTMQLYGERMRRAQKPGEERGLLFIVSILTGLWRFIVQCL